MPSTFFKISVVSPLILQHFDFLLDINQIPVDPIDFLFPLQWINLGFKDFLILRFLMYIIKTYILFVVIAEKVIPSYLRSIQEGGPGITHQTALPLDLTLIAIVFFASKDMATWRHQRMSLNLNSIYDFLIRIIRWKSRRHELKITTIELLVD
jgi:hypothetical protein